MVLGDGYRTLRVVRWFRRVQIGGFGEFLDYRGSWTVFGWYCLPSVFFVMSKCWCWCGQSPSTSKSKMSSISLSKNTFFLSSPWRRNWYSPLPFIILTCCDTDRLQSRLAVNTVTLGDYARPVQIGNFIKNLFAGFQLLNLKNDVLRKRSDGMKYSVGFLYGLFLRVRGWCATGQKGGGCGLWSFVAEFDSQVMT